jgi:hypothetical protein
VVLVALLNQKSNTALLARNDTNSLLPHSQYRSRLSCSLMCSQCSRRVYGRSWVGSWLTYLVGDGALILHQVSQLLINRNLNNIPCGCTCSSGSRGRARTERRLPS